MLGRIPQDMIQSEQGIPSADGYKFSTKPMELPYTIETKLRINKRKSRIRYEGETEEEVTLVIERRDKPAAP